MILKDIEDSDMPRLFSINSGMGPSGIRQREESHPIRGDPIRGTPLHASHPAKDALLLLQPDPAMCHNW